MGFATEENTGKVWNYEVKVRISGDGKDKAYFISGKGAPQLAQIADTHGLSYSVMDQPAEKFCLLLNQKDLEKSAAHDVIAAQMLSGLQTITGQKMVMKRGTILGHSVDVERTGNPETPVYYITDNYPRRGVHYLVNNLKGAKIRYTPVFQNNGALYSDATNIQVAVVVTQSDLANSTSPTAAKILNDLEKITGQSQSTFHSR